MGRKHFGGLAEKGLTIYFPSFLSNQTHSKKVFLLIFSSKFSTHPISPQNKYNLSQMLVSRIINGYDQALTIPMVRTKRLFIVPKVIVDCKCTILFSLKVVAQCQCDAILSPTRPPSLQDARLDRLVLYLTSINNCTDSQIH